MTAALSPHQKEFIKAMQKLAYRHSLWQVWQDFLCLSACALSNAMDKSSFAAREEEYMRTIGRYTKEEAQSFPILFGMLVRAMEETDEPTDILGEMFMALDLANKWTGQFFTPYHVCKVMALFNMDGVEEAIKRRGFVTVNDPAVGGGAMLMAMANAMRQAGFNPQTQMHVIAQDLDIKAVHMTYLHLSLMHIPAVVVHGNSLTLEERSHWYTPAHLMGFWDSKLRRGETVDVPAAKPIKIQKPDVTPVQQSLFQEAS